MVLENQNTKKSCCDTVKVNSSDSVASYLENKLAAGSYITLVVGDGSTGKEITIDVDLTELNSALSVDTFQVKVRSTTDAEYLEDALKSTDGTISLVVDGNTIDITADLEMADLTDTVLTETDGFVVYWNASASRWNSKQLSIDDLSDVDTTGRTPGSFLYYDSGDNEYKAGYERILTISTTNPQVGHLPTEDAVVRNLRNAVIEDASGNALFSRQETVKLEVYGADSGVTFSGGYPGSSDLFHNESQDSGYYSAITHVCLEQKETTNGGCMASFQFHVPEDWDGEDLVVDLLVASSGHSLGDNGKVLLAWQGMYVGGTSGSGSEEVLLTADAGGQVYEWCSFAVDKNDAHTHGILTFMVMPQSEGTSGIEFSDIQIYGGRVRYNTKYINNLISNI